MILQVLESNNCGDTEWFPVWTALRPGTKAHEVPLHIPKTEHTKDLMYFLYPL